MNKFDSKNKQCQISDPIESYFECISSCNMRDGTFISRCLEILKKNDD